MRKEVKENCKGMERGRGRRENRTRKSVEKEEENDKKKPHEGEKNAITGKWKKMKWGKI